MKQSITIAAGMAIGALILLVTLTWPTSNAEAPFSEDETEFITYTDTNDLIVLEDISPPEVNDSIIVWATEEANEEMLYFTDGAGNVALTLTHNGDEPLGLEYPITVVKDANEIEIQDANFTEIKWTMNSITFHLKCFTDGPVPRIDIINQ